MCCARGRSRAPFGRAFFHSEAAAASEVARSQRSQPRQGKAGRREATKKHDDPTRPPEYSLDPSSIFFSRSLFSSPSSSFFFLPSFLSLEKRENAPNLARKKEREGREEGKYGIDFHSLSQHIHEKEAEEEEEEEGGEEMNSFKALGTRSIFGSQWFGTIAVYISIFLVHGCRNGWLCINFDAELGW